MTVYSISKFGTVHSKPILRRAKSLLITVCRINRFIVKLDSYDPPVFTDELKEGHFIIQMR